MLTSKVNRFIKNLPRQKTNASRSLLSTNRSFFSQMPATRDDQSCKTSILPVTISVSCFSMSEVGTGNQRWRFSHPLEKSRKPIMNESTQHCVCHLPSFQTSCILQQSPAKTPTCQNQNKTPHLKERRWQIIKSARQQRSKIAEIQAKIAKLSGSVERAQEMVYKGRFREKPKAEDNADHCSVERFSKASMLAGKKILSFSRKCDFFLVLNIQAMLV